MNTITPTLKTVANHHARRSSPKRRLHLELVDGAAVITFDRPDKSANVIDSEFLDELETALRAVRRYEVSGLVFLSSKPSVFVAGADLASLGEVRGPELAALVERGQRLFSEIASLGIPTVAAIHGACLGGGVELALVCDHRLASDDPATKLGFPETQLGLLPAWGGSTRLPRLIGLPKALDLVLSGKQIVAKHARKLGLIDEVVPKERMTARALALLNEAPPRRKSHFLTNNPLAARVIAFLTKRKLRAKTRGNYPAPLAALEVMGHGSWVAGGDLEESFARERVAFVRLAETEAARHLLRLFFLQEKAKHYRHDVSIDRKSLPSVERTAVIGAGVMGAGIAQTFAARGFPVVLADLDPVRVAAGMKSVSKLFDEAVERRIFTAHEARRKLDLVVPTAERVPLRSDLVVEAAVEDLEVKKTIFADLCARTSPETILATNTSALSVTELAKAEGLTHPERVLGLHFFNPVSRMKLVEIVTTELTSPEVVERTLAFVRALGKTPVVVKDSPGFLVNRVLMPYLIEAGRLVESGVPVAAIDEAMLDFGMPMGPLRLLDEIGLDVATHVAETMVAAFGERFAPPLLLADLVRADHLGKKSGRGFYRHERGKEGIPETFAVPLREVPDGTDLSARLNGLMVEEAKRCLAEGLVRDAGTIDLALILGIGYAPFRGGPLGSATNDQLSVTRSRSS